MPLLELPQELLDDILDIALPNGGFQSFVLACKTAHRVCKSHIQRYNALRRAWRLVPADGNTTQCVTALDIIEAVVRAPEIAWFVETLDLSRVPDLDHEVDDDENWKIEDEKVLEQAKQLVIDSPAIKAAGQDPEGWMLAVHDDHDIDMPAVMNANAAKLEEVGKELSPNPRCYSYAQHEIMQTSRTVILLTLFPNLKELTLPKSWGYITGQDANQAPMYFMDLLHSMAREAYASPKENLPLSKLRRLHPYEEFCYQGSPKSGLTELAPLAILPRLREVEMTNLIAVNADDENVDTSQSSGERGLTFKWPYDKNVNSNIRVLQLHGCCMDAEGIGEFLPHTPQLTSLLYTHYPKYRGVGVHWRTGDFIDEIQKHCWKSLKELCIGTYSTSRSGWGSPMGQVSSLKNFEVLETLRMPMSLLWKIEGLASILPSSIKHVGLIASIDDLDRSYDRLSQPDFPKGHPAFKYPDDIKALGLESLVVFVHEGQWSRTDLETLEASTQFDELRAAGARLVEADHERMLPCSCMTRDLRDSQ